ncbi:MAG TPA: DUF4956 domain-containing protein [Chloroflexota bacterium]|nr:DUF4956 domain-containing protein [Chloroflexota bacterium]
MPTLTNLLIGFLFNLAVALIIVRFIYYPVKQNKNYVFTFVAFNTTIYFIMSALTSIELSVGVGFGLFGLFSLLRYRTDPMPPREMTYLFVVIALPILNSVLMADADWAYLVVANTAVISVLTFLEQGWGFRYEASRRLTYERIELIKPENYHLLLADLRERTGLPVKRCEVGDINFLRDTAEIKIYYDQPDEQTLTATILEAYAANGRYPGDDD